MHSVIAFSESENKRYVSLNCVRDLSSFYMSAVLLMSTSFLWLGLKLQFTVGLGSAKVK